MEIKDYKKMGLLLFSLGVIALIGGNILKIIMELKKKFLGIVEIKGEEYAVIDTNQDKMILQKCKKNFKTLEIYCDNVKLKSRHKIDKSKFVDK